jgi:hypothetical protein
LSHPAEERGAGIELVQGHVFVRLVRLVDRTGPAHHGGDSRLLKQACLGTVRHRMHLIASRERAGELHRRGIDVAYEPGIGGVDMRLEIGLGRARPVARKDVGRARFGAGEDRLLVAVGEGAVFPHHARLACEHVHRRPAGDDARLDRSVGRLEILVAILLQLFAQGGERGDELARHHHGVGAA